MAHPTPLPRRISAVFLALLAMTGLSACQTGAHYRTISWAQDNNALIVNTLPEFANAPSRHVVFTDRWQHEEYGLYQGGGAQSEIVLSLATERDDIVLNYELTVRRNIESWQFNRRHAIAYGERTTIGAIPFGEFDIHTYRLTGVNRDCFGFSNEWDRRPEDLRNRISKVLFGYYCEPPGVALSAQKILDVTDALGVRGISAASRTRFAPAPNAQGSIVQTEALAFAQGTPAGTGNVNYPFDMADIIEEPTGSHDWPR